MNSNYNAEQLLATYISDLYRYWRSALDAQLTNIEPGFTRTQWHILGKLLCKGPRITQQQLGEYLFMDAGQLTRVLRQMEESGVVHKSMDQADRRIRHLELTDIKAPYVQKLTNSSEKINSAICSVLNKQEQKQLLGLLERVTEAAFKLNKDGE
jgi:DNA-binding MarR family transcriptional regulator